MKVEIYLYERIIPNITSLQQINMVDHKLEPTYIGSVNINKFDPFMILGIVYNFTARSTGLDTYIKSNGGCGLMFINPETEERYLVKSGGFVIGDEDTINKYVEENRYRLCWK